MALLLNGASMRHPQLRLNNNPRASIQASRPRPVVHCTAKDASAAGVESPPTYQPSVDLLKQAAKDSSVPARDVFLALRDLQKAKVSEDGWGEIIGCNKYWKLIFNAGKDQVKKNSTDPQAGKGSYFPIYAAQNFNLTDPPKGELKNGVFFGLLAGFQLIGPYEMKGKRLEFDIKQVVVKIGPWKFGPFGKEMKSKDNESPFFVFFYVDDDIICAQGKGGGVAYWAKCSATEVIKEGIF